jgi:hypothetical protein
MVLCAVVGFEVANHFHHMQQAGETCQDGLISLHPKETCVIDWMNLTLPLA